MKADKRPALKKYDTVGWRELVAVPELNIRGMRAKIDTGARTSAIHAVDQKLFERDGQDWVRFRVPASKAHKSIYIEAPVHDQRAIKNTRGIPQTRIIIEVLMLIGSHKWHIELSLADRENMGFDMILGRTAIRRRKVLVDPGRSFLMGPPKYVSEHFDLSPTNHSNEERTMAPVQTRKDKKGIER